MASCVNPRDFRVRVCDAPDILLIRFVLSSRYLSERQTIRLLKKHLYTSTGGSDGVAAISASFSSAHHNA